MANEIGEIKAMREALEAICNAWDTFINGLEEDMDGHYPGHYLARRADFENKYLQLAKQALAAPPRNCDRFADADMARTAWLNDMENWDEFGNPKKDIDNWLFATATEKERIQWLTR